MRERLRSSEFFESRGWGRGVRDRLSKQQDERDNSM